MLNSKRLRHQRRATKRSNQKRDFDAYAPLADSGRDDAECLASTSGWVRVARVEVPGGSYFVSGYCLKCEDILCLDACPVGATYRNPEGVITIVQNRCTGSGKCVAACPHGIRPFFS